MEARDLNEYAFALGSVAHYAADNVGHPRGVNRAVPLLHPKLRAKFGPVVTYEQNPNAHLKTEFGFDVAQIARGRYAPQAYHDFIGFEVAKPLLERAFLKTYSIEMKSIFLSLDLALGTYRHSVSRVIPEMTKVAWQVKKDELEKNGITKDQFVFRLRKDSYRKEWGAEYEKPGFVAKVLAFLFRVLPKLGMFRALAFKPPTLEAEALFLRSFDVTLEQYRRAVAAAGRGTLRLDDLNFDTGQAARAGEYRMADETYAELVDKLADQKFANIDPALRADILAYYGDLDGPIATKKKPRKWAKLMAELNQLRATASGAP